MRTMIKVERKAASKIQARAPERGVSVNAYLQELIEEKPLDESKTINRLNAQERVRKLREWASGYGADAARLSDEAINRECIYSDRN